MRSRLLTPHNLAFILATTGWLVCVGFAARGDATNLFTPLTGVLVVCALAANIMAAQWESNLDIGGSFMAAVIGMAFLGPVPAFAILAVSELGAWLFQRYRVQALAINLFSTGAPILVLATLFAEIAPADDSVAFYVLLGVFALAQLAVNYVLTTSLVRALDEGSFVPRMSVMAELLPSALLTTVLTILTAAIYVQLGIAGALLVMVSILAFSYMARLVLTARERTRQYASLSWGVLSGLLRTLDMRDARAARHAAAVARFSRDIAQAADMTPEDCELAHTAGLLHDIGRFGLSDRVMERGRTLMDQDWEGIRRHPELGAEMLRDLGIYGPVAEIVRSHHERVDGRGYPDGLTGDEIPEIAKIVAVAEVYDTLTAEGTYRTPMSSFEAITELRRVSGSQLDSRYVELFTQLLAGQSVEYRHADSADFDIELDMERRLNEAAEGSSVALSPPTPAEPPERQASAS